MSANRSPLPRPGVAPATANRRPPQAKGFAYRSGSWGPGQTLPTAIQRAIDLEEARNPESRPDFVGPPSSARGTGGSTGGGSTDGGSTGGGSTGGSTAVDWARDAAAAAMPSKADALRNAGFGGLAEWHDMQNKPLGSTSALSGPGNRRMITSPARSLERQARRYAKFGDAGRAAASEMMSQAAQIRAGEPSLRTEAGIERDQARDTVAGNLAQGVINRLSGDDEPLTSGGRPLQGQGRRVGSQR